MGKNMSHIVRPDYARFDPAHVFDGLFVPTSGRRRERLYVPPRPFGGVEIGFYGFEQLGAGDQSVLLALTAQMGIEPLVVESQPNDETDRNLRTLMAFNRDDGAPIARRRTSLYRLLIDAGYHPDKSTAIVKESLHRLRAVQIREIDRHSGWDRTCNLIAIDINHKTSEMIVAANPRLTEAVFHGQHIKISLLERNALDSEIAKLLHCWLCSNVRLGQSLGDGNGAYIDTFGPHVWGEQAWNEASRKVRANRRALLRDALDEIAQRTMPLHDGYGWVIDQTSSGLVLVSRPKELPRASNADPADTGSAS